MVVLDAQTHKSSDQSQYIQTSSENHLRKKSMYPIPKKNDSILDVQVHLSFR